jgi:hypothetical protein
LLKEQLSSSEHVATDSKTFLDHGGDRAGAIDAQVLVKVTYARMALQQNQFRVPNLVIALIVSAASNVLGTASIVDDILGGRL